MCSGVGACRKTLTGTMCPSYMATRDEAHSTRGRANALRLAMARRDSSMATRARADWGTSGVYRCPRSLSGVPRLQDGMPGRSRHGARFKSEFLVRLLAAARRAAPRARVLGPHPRPVGVGQPRSRRSLNPMAGNSAPCAGAQRAAARHRSPALAAADGRRRTLAAAWRKRRCGHDAPPAAVLFNDTFTNYFDPGDRTCGGGRPGERAGIAVEPWTRRPAAGDRSSRRDCCAEARDPRVRKPFGGCTRWRPTAGSPIIVLEPSCLSALKDDVPALLRGPDQERARRVADACMLFEEFLEHEVSGGRAELSLGSGPSHVILHGHCHQKSLGLVTPALALMRRIPGAVVTDLDAGCCGMAGSFGYVHDHFDVSRTIGERRLLPTARRLAAGSVLVASGMSCRHQVHDFTGVRALHPAELLRSVMQFGGAGRLHRFRAPTSTEV